MNNVHARSAHCVAVRVEGVKDAVPDIGHDRAAIPRDGQCCCPRELARPLAWTAKLADEPAAGTDDDDSLGLAIEDVKVSRAVERHTPEAG